MHKTWLDDWGKKEEGKEEKRRRKEEREPSLAFTCMFGGRSHEEGQFWPQEKRRRGELLVSYEKEERRVAGKRKLPWCTPSMQRRRRIKKFPYKDKCLSKSLTEGERRGRGGEKSSPQVLDPHDKNVVCIFACGNTSFLAPSRPSVRPSSVPYS